MAFSFYLHINVLTVGVLIVKVELKELKTMNALCREEKEVMDELHLGYA